MPRILLAEWNTHRVFSRSSASSRAIPVAKRIAAVRADPFVPAAFGANQRGMSAGSVLEGRAAEEARNDWLAACEYACLRAASMDESGVHKQWANRLIEPFSYTEVVTGATKWSNFFHRRISKHAQPEMQVVARVTKAAIDASTPVLKQVGEWHLPFVTEEEKATNWTGIDILPKLSAARTARVSYLTHAGVRDLDEDLRLHDDLLKNGHMSPFEMPAMVGKRYDLRSRHVIDPHTHLTHDTGNYDAPWLQYRKMIKNEHDLPGDE